MDDGLLDQVKAKMRADFALVQSHRKEREEWDEQDIAEIGAAIKAAIDANDVDQIHGWSLWLADLAHSVAAWNNLVRGSLARARYAAKEQARERAEQQTNGRKGARA